MTPEERQAEVDKFPPVQAVTLVTHYADGTKEDWHFETQGDAKTFILAIQAAKGGYGEEWMTEIFKVDIRPFAASIN